MNRTNEVTTPNEDVAHRQRIVAAMHTETFEGFFRNEFSNLRKAIFARDWGEIESTIQALESCAVQVCEQFDEVWKRLLRCHC